MNDTDLLFESERKLRTGEWTFFDAPIAEFMRQIAMLDTAMVRGRKIATMSHEGARALEDAVSASAAFRRSSGSRQLGRNYVGELFGVPILVIDSQTLPIEMSAIPE